MPDKMLRPIPIRQTKTSDRKIIQKTEIETVARRTTMTKIKLYTILFAAFLLFTQCESPHHFQEQTAFGESWNKNAAATFNFEIKDTADAYTVTLLTRNTNDYPYSNLYIFTKLTDPKGQEFTDTLQYYLAFQDGEWIGKGKNLKQLYLVYRENVSIKDTGNYKLSV